MSIFKSTFKPYVIRQINTRQNLISVKNRPVEFSHYVSSKTPWIKLTSFVDYKDSPELAKKNILMGGSLYYSKRKVGDAEEDFWSQRRGVVGRGAAYDGDVSTTQYGIRPMPGVTGITTKSSGAYGSLTEVTVKFIAWDVKQLDDLAILYMRPGYRVLVEWGWSMFLNTFKTSDIEQPYSNSPFDESASFDIEASPLLTIDCFKPGVTQDMIYDTLEELRKKYSANYDGVLGSIKNFEYSLMPNGAYECSVTVTSIGDVIDTIRINNVSSGDIKAPEPASENANTDIANDVQYKTQFELLFDLYAALNTTNTRRSAGNEFILAIDRAIPEKDRSYIDTFVYKQDPSLANFGLMPAIPGTGNATQPELDPRDFAYIQFGYLLHILNVYKRIFSDGENAKIEIEIPGNPSDVFKIGNGLCQASFNSISVDPRVCLIKNSKATLFTVEGEGRPGFDPYMTSTERVSVVQNTSDMKEYLYGDTNFGLISNVYVNIKQITSLFREQAVSKKGYVYIGQLISSILEKISFSLGSINDFDKYVKDNKVVIIDKHYTELAEDSDYSKKYKVNISGNNTIVRSHKVLSKIFPSQANMVAIAAQSRENIAALQTSTYNFLNKNLKDRMAPTEDVSNVGDSTVMQNEDNKKILITGIQRLIEYTNLYTKPNRFGISGYNMSIPMNSYLNTLLVQIERGTDYKGVVPMSVELTMDGVSGLTIGEIFTVNKDVLPSDYEGSHVGFIVTGISNEVNTNSWTTTITSQTCLLDQVEKQLKSRKIGQELINEVVSKISSDIKANEDIVNAFNALAALVADSLSSSITVDDSGNLKYSSTPKTTYLRDVLGTVSMPGFFSDSASVEDTLKMYSMLYKIEVGKQKASGNTDVQVNSIFTQNDGYFGRLGALQTLFQEEFNRVQTAVVNFYKELLEDSSIFAKILNYSDIIASVILQLIKDALIGVVDILIAVTKVFNFNNEYIDMGTVKLIQDIISYESGKLSPIYFKSIQGEYQNTKSGILFENIPLQDTYKILI